MATLQREKRDASPGLKMQAFTVPFPFGSECGANGGSLTEFCVTDGGSAASFFAAAKRTLSDQISTH